jgi:membrane-associated phospholipid phosphatase
MLCGYLAYQVGRVVGAGSLAEGTDNAREIVSLQQALGIDWELGVQRAVEEHGIVMPFWNGLYLASQVLVVPLSLILVWFMARRGYAEFRNQVALVWVAAVVWFTVQPVAPPRHSGIGLADTVTTQTPLSLDSDFARAFYNPVAAMPSVHVAMAVIVGVALWRLGRFRGHRLLAVAHPVLVSVAVVVTGNHFVLDVLAGLAVGALAVGVALLLRVPPAAAVSATRSGRAAEGR